MNRVPATGPSIMGIDLLTVATVLAAVAAFAVLLAIYAATTVRDPMARRVKALNERREQLKAGIVASTSKRRKSITNQNEVADKVRGILSSLKVLQDKQVITAVTPSTTGRMKRAKMMKKARSLVRMPACISFIWVFLS